MTMSNNLTEDNVTSPTTLAISIDTTWHPPNFDASVTNILLAIVLVFMDVVTMVGNGFVLIAFAVDRRLLQPFNMFILNLAITDFLVAITAMTFYTIDTLLGYWPFGYVMCCIWIFFDFAMTFASVFTLVAISVDRFWCVTWAVHYKIHNNRIKTGIILAVVWMCVFVIWTPPFISDRLKKTEDNFCIWEPSENQEFVILVAVIGHYLPFFIMVFCYLKVLYVMRRQSRIVGNHQTNSLQRNSSQGTSQNQSSRSQGNNPPTISCQQQLTDNTDTTGRLQVSTISTISEQQHSGAGNIATEASRSSTNHYSRDRKIFVTLSYVLGSYIICWLPFYITFDTYTWKPELVPDKLYTFFFWVTYANSTLNPIIYAFTSKEFRVAFKKTLKCMYRCKN